MIIFLTVVLVVLALALIGLVLMQPDRSHGMAGSFGGGASATLFGVSEDGGPLARWTKYVAVMFLIVAFTLYIVSVKSV